MGLAPVSSSNTKDNNKDESSGQDSSGESDDGDSASDSESSENAFHEKTAEQEQIDVLLSLVQEGNEEQVLEKLNSGISVNVKNEEGETPLHRAALSSKAHLVEILIEKRCRCYGQNQFRIYCITFGL